MDKYKIKVIQTLGESKNVENKNEGEGEYVRVRVRDFYFHGLPILTFLRFDLLIIPVFDTFMFRHFYFWSKCGESKLRPAC